MLEKNLSFSASTTAWIWRGRKDRKEPIMGGEELVRKDFTGRISLGLRLAI